MRPKVLLERAESTPATLFAIFGWLGQYQSNAYVWSFFPTWNYCSVCIIIWTFCWIDRTRIDSVPLVPIGIWSSGYHKRKQDGQQVTGSLVFLSCLWEQVLRGIQGHGSSFLKIHGALAPRCCCYHSNIFLWVLQNDFIMPVIRQKQIDDRHPYRCAHEILHKVQ